MKFQVLETVYQPTKNGAPKVHKPGTVLPAKVYNQLTPHAQAKCKPLTYVKWSKVEIEQIVDLYLKTVEVDGTLDSVGAFAKHTVQFPERPFNSFDLELKQIRHLDTFVPQEGLYGVTQVLIDVLHEVDPVRFPEVSAKAIKMQAELDTLLAQIRA